MSPAAISSCTRRTAAIQSAGATSASNNAALVAALQGHDDRAAWYACVLALVCPASWADGATGVEGVTILTEGFGLPEGAVLVTAEGRVDGLFVDAPRGAGGFGYDPHFLLPGREVATTMAELDADDKHAISHRGQAMRRLSAWLAGARRVKPKLPLTYGTYLGLDRILNAQFPQSDEHDEPLFIAIHQVYELWFKQLLHEVGLLQRSLDGDALPVALATLKRILTILKTLVSQVDVLATMTPLSFGSFRARLASSSGFQSVQFRELEIALGHRGGSRTRLLDMVAAAAGPLEAARMKQRLDSPSVYDAFLRFLDRAGFAMPEEILNRDPSEANPEHDGVRARLAEVYRTRPDLTQVCERLVDLDEGLQEWRYRHVKMVERTIGTKSGTGGSSGVEYLRSTLFRTLFPDLWNVRSEF